MIYSETGTIQKSYIFGLGVLSVLLSIGCFNIGLKIGDTIQDIITVEERIQRKSVVTHPHLQPRKLVQVTDPQTKLDLIHTTLNEKQRGLAYYATQIPKTVSELLSKSKHDVIHPLSAEIRAAAWIVQNDTIRNEQEHILRRFALVHLYYSTNGNQWINKTNWLNPVMSHCEWYGVTCCKDYLFSPVCANVTADPDGITELDLFHNQLIGTIPTTINLLNDLQVIFFNDNYLEGSIPTKAFQLLPKLIKLYLHHNRLNGTVPDIHNGILDSYFVHGNDLTGEWPERLCPTCPSCAKKILPYFGLDCEEVTCSSECCVTWVNCFVNPPRLQPSLKSSSSN